MSDNMQMYSLPNYNINNQYPNMAPPAQGVAPDHPSKPQSSYPSPIGPPSPIDTPSLNYNYPAVGTLGINGTDLITKPPCPLNKERLECTEKGYGVHVGGEFIAMPTPPANIIIHQNPMESIMNENTTKPSPVYNSSTSYTLVGSSYSVVNPDTYENQSPIYDGYSSGYYSPCSSGSDSPISTFSEDGGPIALQQQYSDSSTVSEAYVTPSNAMVNVIDPNNTGINNTYGVGVPNTPNDVTPVTNQTSDPALMLQQQQQQLYQAYYYQQYQQNPPNPLVNMYNNYHTPSYNYTGGVYDMASASSNSYSESATVSDYASNHKTTKRQNTPSRDSTDDDDDDEDDENDSNLTAEELKRKRLKRKAELARMSRLSKKNRLNDLEQENTELRRQLEEVKRVHVSNMGINVVDLQYALQGLANVIVPALQVMSHHSKVPVVVSNISFPPIQANTATSNETMKVMNDITKTIGTLTSSQTAMYPQVVPTTSSTTRTTKKRKASSKSR